MKVRMRFIKKGSMQYVGHLDIMRYFQKLFRRCGLDVSYSNGFNPHQIMSFASPLGLGLTSIAEYLDVSLESFAISGDENGNELTSEEWMTRINAESNGMILVTAINVMPDDVKPSMALLAGASYMIEFSDITIANKIKAFFDAGNELVYIKETKKSSKEIDLKANIYIVEDDYKKFAKKTNEYAICDSVYEERNLEIKDGNLYMLCTAGSSLNIKPEMLVELYEKSTGISAGSYDITRIDMFLHDEKYISMSL